MTTLAASVGRITGGATRRLDRLSDGQFAAVAFLPGALLVGFIVIPPILAVFGMSVFRIELVRDAATPFIGLGNYERILRDDDFLASVPRTIVARRRADVALGAAGAGHGAAPQPRVPRVDAARRGRAHPVRHRPGGHRPVLGVHLQQPFRHPDRDRDRARPRRRPGSLARRHAVGNGRGGDRGSLALDADPRAHPARRAQDHPRGALPGGEDGRRDDVAVVPVRHAARDPQHAAGRDHPRDPDLAPDLRHPVHADEGRPGSGHDRHPVLHLPAGIPEPEPRVLGGARGLPVRADLPLQRIRDLPAAPEHGASRTGRAEVDEAVAVADQRGAQAVCPAPRVVGAPVVLERGPPTNRPGGASASPHGSGRSLGGVSCRARRVAGRARPVDRDRVDPDRDGDDADAARPQPQPRRRVVRLPADASQVDRIARGERLGWRS